MRTGRSFIVAGALITALTLSALQPVQADEELSIASPPLSYYAPVPTYHDPIAHGVGVLSSYVVGPWYTQAVIYDTHEREYELVVGGDFTMEGQHLRCEQGPQADEAISKLVCPDWPTNLALDQTPIVFTYWKTRLDDHEIAVLRSVDLAPSSWK